MIKIFILKGIDVNLNLNLISLLLLFFSIEWIKRAKKSILLDYQSNINSFNSLKITLSLYGFYVDKPHIRAGW